MKLITLYRHILCIPGIIFSNVTCTLRGIPYVQLHINQQFYYLVQFDTYPLLSDEMFTQNRVTVCIYLCRYRGGQRHHRRWHHRMSQKVHPGVWRYRRRDDNTAPATYRQTWRNGTARATGEFEIHIIESQASCIANTWLSLFQTNSKTRPACLR